MNTEQLTLGELIAKLTPIVENQKERINNNLEEADVIYDFGYFHPTQIDSWRGSYCELALNYKDYTAANLLKSSKFLKLLINAVNDTFQGYKGGDFTMNEDTPIWVANYGQSGFTAVVDVIDNGHQIILCTAYKTY